MLYDIPSETSFPYIIYYVAGRVFYQMRDMARRVDNVKYELGKCVGCVIYYMRNEKCYMISDAGSGRNGHEVLDEMQL